MSQTVRFRKHSNTELYYDNYLSAPVAGLVRYSLGSDLACPLTS